MLVRTIFVLVVVSVIGCSRHGEERAETHPAPSIVEVSLFPDRYVDRRATVTGYLARWEQVEATYLFESQLDELLGRLSLAVEVEPEGVPANVFASCLNSYVKIQGTFRTARSPDWVPMRLKLTQLETVHRITLEPEYSSTICFSSSAPEDIPYIPGNS